MLSGQETPPTDTRIQECAFILLLWAPRTRGGIPVAGCRSHGVRGCDRAGSRIRHAPSTGPRGWTGRIPDLAVHGPEHQVYAALASQALRPLRNRVNDFYSVARGYRYWLRARLQQSRAPASIRADHGVGTEWPPDAPVTARQHLHEPLAPSLQGRFLEFRRWVLPVDLVNDNEVGTGRRTRTLNPANTGDPRDPGKSAVGAAGPVPTRSTRWRVQPQRWYE